MVRPEPGGSGWHREHCYEVIIVRFCSCPGSNMDLSASQHE